MGTTEAYQVLGLKRYQLFQAINRGELPAYRISRWIRLRRDDVEAYARNRAA